MSSSKPKDLLNAQNISFDIIEDKQLLESG